MDTKWLLLIGLAAVAAAGIAFPVVRHVVSAPVQMVDAVSTGLEIKQLETMIVGFQKKYSRWPTELEFVDLVKSNYRPNRTDSLQSHGLVDMWSQPYSYFRRGSGFVLISTGPDRRPGTTDDIILLRR
ncbi:MAG: hypothetical protein C4523_13410 [Myxococcales bacterium]|nr:MAG: hypothetical protein C4523_13410 [Myxococcales bacterium]